MADKSKYFTRKRSNEGVRMPILSPAGKDEGEWFRVLGTESTVFKAAIVEKDRRFVEIAQLPSDQQEDAKSEAWARLTSALVAGWSFDNPCTPDEVFELLSEDRDLIVQVNEFVTDRARFFGEESSGSVATPKEASDSTSEKSAPTASQESQSAST